MPSTHLGENLNDWTRPREPAPAGIEIIFVMDGVLVGDTHFGLINRARSRFTGVRMLSENPPAIAFRTISTSAEPIQFPYMGSARCESPFPAASAEAGKVLNHYRQVSASGAADPNPPAAPQDCRAHQHDRGADLLRDSGLSASCAKSRNYSDANDVSGLLIVLGLLVGGAMSIVALIVWKLGQGGLASPEQFERFGGVGKRGTFGSSPFHGPPCRMSNPSRSHALAALPDRRVVVQTLK